MGIARKKDDEIERKINEMEKSKKKNDKITKEKDVDGAIPFLVSKYCQLLFFVMAINQQQK